MKSLLASACSLAVLLNVGFWNRHCAIAQVPVSGLISSPADGLVIGYPRKDAKVDAPASFIVGAAPAGSQVECNGQPMKINAAGFFAHVVRLQPGRNSFLIKKTGGSAPIQVTFTRPAPEQPLPVSPLKVIAESAGPQEDLGVDTGDIVQFALRASPGSRVQVAIGKHRLPLYPPAQAKNSAINMGRDTAFGVTYQRTAATRKDLYSAFYKVTAADDWHQVRPVYTVSSGASRKTVPAAGKITTVRQPQVLHTVHDDTIVRMGPGAARTTPLPSGVRFLSDGFRGTWRRLELAPGKHVWIAAEDLEPDQDAGRPPEGKVSTVNLGSDAYGAWLRLPMSQKLPFRIEQGLAPSRLVLTVFGVTSDTDFVTPETGGTVEPKDRESAVLLDFVSWRQRADNQYELTVHLKKKHQWGFYAEYQGTDLVLHIKSSPKLSGTSAQESLRGCTVCVDPGHGGAETGAIGCSGLREADVNLAMGLRLKEHLERSGARVVMTRTGDAEVSLAERVKIAIDAHADILVSVHNNALPDNANPWTEHGASSYWYQQQSIELAKAMKETLVAASGLPDFGTRYQNLFLCRPSHMPAALVEVGFMIHPDEYAQLINPAFQDKAAEGIFTGLKNYIVNNANEKSAEAQ